MWVQSLGWEDPLEKDIAVFLPGESRLTGHSAWGHTESDTTEVTWQAREPVPNWTAMHRVLSVSTRGKRSDLCCYSGKTIQKTFYL